MSSATRTVRILGTHGVPANYGGFETAAEQVGLFLRDQGWRVVVYCQSDGPKLSRKSAGSGVAGPDQLEQARAGEPVTDTWHGLERVTIPVDREGWLGTSQFDLRSIRHAVKHRDLCLTFGYNTAIFNVAQRVLGIPNVINMDGIEWSRARWGFLRQAILYVNERIACFVGNELIADHPEIETYLRSRAPARKITTITYGGPIVSAAPTEVLEEYGLIPGRYLTLIARPIPENSILEIVRGFSRRDRDIDLVVLGDYRPDTDPFHAEVLAAAGDRVKFLGGIYEPERVQALRFHAMGYLHGHTVGGTNPSLVEALGAGNPVLAHDNPYNRWVAADAGRYFTTAEDVDALVSALTEDPGLVTQLGAAARLRHASEFTWQHVAGQYERLLVKAQSKKLLRRTSRRGIGRSRPRTDGTELA